MDGEISRQEAYPQDDAELVSAFKGGDKSAFDKLILMHKDKVFNMCYRLLGNYEEANDSAQETFVKVYRSLKNFRLESAFSTWLYRIAVNTCKNKLVSSKYRHNKMMVRLDNPIETEEGTHTIEIGNNSLSPANELERKEKGIRIQRAIDSLPEAQKTLVVLRDIEGLSYEEIAKITSYNLGTVKSKLARARQQLREKLKGLI